MALKKIVSKINSLGISGLLKAVMTKVKYIYHKPKIVINTDYKTIGLGIDDGKKVFIDRPNLKNSILISCGLGEEASFDIEFAKKYGARVVMLDPTPRAISHYNEIIDQIKGQDLIDVQFDKKNPLMENYNLSGLKAEQLILEKFALWTENTILNFYLPVNKANVSHSLVNYQNDYKVGDEFEHIKVKTITLREIMDKYEVEKIEILKLDIEGAEIQVLEKMLEDRILPNQICVEFDGLNVPSKTAKENFERIDSLLRTSGYEIIFYDGLADFTYLLNTKDKTN